MKTKLKLWSTRLFLVLFLMTTIIACQKDDDSISTTSLDIANEVASFPTVTTLSKEEFLKHDGAYTTLQNHLFSTRTSENRQVSTNGMTLYEEQVIYITYENYHSYTFSVIQEENSNLTQNVVLSSLPDGTYETSLITYDLTEEETTRLRNNIAIDLTGKMSYQEIVISPEIIEILTTRNSKGKNLCYYDQYSSGEYNYTNLGECEANHGAGNCAYNPIVTSNCSKPADTDIGVDANDNDTGSGNGGGSSTDEEETNDNDVNNNGIPDHLEDEEDDGNVDQGGGDTSDSSDNNNNNGGGGVFGTSPLIVAPVETTILYINSLIEPNLTDDQEDFLRENPEFAEEALEALENEGEVDFDEQIINIIDDENIRCLYAKLADTQNSELTTLLSNFEGESEFGIRIQSPEHVYHVENGQETTQEVNGRTTYRSDSNIMEIRINSSLATTRPALGVVRTIIHEYIHAEIFRLIYTTSPAPEDQSFRDTYTEYEEGNFQANASHETMAELYIDLLTSALADYHENVLVGDFNYLTNDGQISLANFYEALAWQGLKNHNVQAYLDLPQSRKDEIDAALNQYYHLSTRNCPN